MLRDCLNKFSYVRGPGNSIRKRGVIVKSKIQIIGEGNILEFCEESVLLHVTVSIRGNNNKVVIGKASYLEKTDIHVEDGNCTILIGERTFIGPSHLAVTENGSRLTIGNDCMISSHVQIRTGDSHSIINKLGERMNYAKDVLISDNVWIGEDAKILKGVELGIQTIVSTGAIVTKSFRSGNLLLGGIPAKILKDGISWKPEREK